MYRFSKARLMVLQLGQLPGPLGSRTMVNQNSSIASTTLVNSVQPHRLGDVAIGAQFIALENVLIRL